MTQKIRLTESELYNMIAEQVNEALQDEGMMDFFRGAGKKIGNDISNGAKTAWNKGKQAAQNAATNVKNYVNSVNQAGQMSSMNADNQKIADQYGMDVAKVKEILGPQSQQLASDIHQRKIIDFLLANNE